MNRSDVVTDRKLSRAFDSNNIHDRNYVPDFARYDAADGLLGAVVPDGWTCPPQYYGSGDGCDCKCGVWDPDCGTQNVSYPCTNCDTPSVPNALFACIKDEEGASQCLSIAGFASSELQDGSSSNDGSDDGSNDKDDGKEGWWIAGIIGAFVIGITGTLIAAHGVKAIKKRRQKTRRQTAANEFGTPMEESLLPDSE